MLTREAVGEVSSELDIQGAVEKQAQFLCSVPPLEELEV